MKIRPIIYSVGGAAMAIAIGGLGHHFGGNAHIRRKIGQEPLAKATCLTCHFVSIAQQPWAKPRPHHDAPAGLALSPDGTKPPRLTFRQGKSCGESR